MTSPFLFSREEMRAIDRDAHERLGLPTLTLMENAGAGATREILARFRSELDRVVIVGGTGQNGGDAWVVARHLLTAVAGIRPRCVLVGDPEKVSGDAKTNLEVLRAMGVTIEVPGDATALYEVTQTATLMVDGVFGTGLDREVTGLPAAALQQLGALAGGRPVVALDLPSGIDADTGAELGGSVHATLTTTFGAHKRGLWQYPGRARAGEIVLVPIGVPAHAPLGLHGAKAWLSQSADGRIHGLERRFAEMHKGDAGRVVIFAGAVGTTGAAMLAARSALRAGAGLVTVAPRPDARSAIEAKSLESMTASLPAGDGDDAVRAAVELASRADSAVLGPGFGHLDSLAAKLAIALPIPTVLDADALTAIAARPEALRDALAPRVLTPHPGEAARLLACTVDEVQRDRYRAAATIAERTGQVVVLKGAGTIVSTPDGRSTVCAHGTPALATGGTGDVLAGIVGAILAARSADPDEVFGAATDAVLWHALAGELAANGADRGLLAHEVADALPRVLTTWRTSC